MLKLIQNVTICNMIPGIYTKGNKQKPAVIMAHGIMGSKNEYLNTLACIAECLELLDIASLRIDFAGHGDSQKSLDDFSLYSQIDDLNESIKWMLDSGYPSIILLGVSFGAPPVVIASELNKSVIKSLLIAPVIDYKATFINTSTSWGNDTFGLQKLLKGIQNNGLFLDKSYYLCKTVLQDILLADIPGFIRTSTKTITIFHGDSDDMVPYSASLQVSQDNENVELITMIKTEHGITEVGDEDFSKPATKYNLQQIVLNLQTIISR